MSLLRFVCPREIDLGHATDREFRGYIEILSYITAIIRINSFTTFLPFAGVTSLYQLRYLFLKWN